MAQKKTESKKEIILSRINPNSITVENGLLTYKRVRVPFVEFSQEFKTQIEGLIAHALGQAKEKGPIRLNKIEFEGRTYQILNEIKSIIGTNDNMAAGATLFANMSYIEPFVGLYFHDLWVGTPTHFKDTKDKPSIKEIDPKKLPKLPTV